MSQSRKFQVFREHLSARRQMLGTFVKTPTTHATEMFGVLGFDFVIFDQEHAAINSESLEAMILAARAYDISSIVRVAEANAALILAALDCGATGVMVPHVYSAEIAEKVAASCRYRGGKRGFAGTTRPGDYGAHSFSDHKTRQDAEVTCIIMIEDIAALDVLDEIMSVDGVDAIFIGRGDLTAALEQDKSQSPETTKVVEQIAAAAKRNDMPVITLCTDRDDAMAMHKFGISAFAVSSDHGFMRKSAAAALKQFSLPLE